MSEPHEPQLINKATEILSSDKPKAHLLQLLQDWINTDPELRHILMRHDPDAPEDDLSLGELVNLVMAGRKEMGTWLVPAFIVVKAPTAEEADDKAARYIMGDMTEGEEARSIVTTRLDEGINTRECKGEIPGSITEE